MNTIKEFIYKGITYDGVYGYFRNGELIYELTNNEYYKPKQWHETKAKKLNYEYKIIFHEEK